MVVRVSHATAGRLVARTISRREARVLDLPGDAMLQKVLWWVDTDWAGGTVRVEALENVYGFVSGARLTGLRARWRARRRDVTFPHGWKDLPSGIVFRREGCAVFELRNARGERRTIVFEITRYHAG